jgi:hypothetical protein
MEAPVASMWFIMRAKSRYAAAHVLHMLQLILFGAWLRTKAF